MTLVPLFRRFAHLLPSTGLGLLLRGALGLALALPPLLNAGPVLQRLQQMDVGIEAIADEANGRIAAAQSATSAAFAMLHGGTLSSS